MAKYMRVRGVLGHLVGHPALPAAIRYVGLQRKSDPALQAGPSKAREQFEPVWELVAANAALVKAAKKGGLEWDGKYIVAKTPAEASAMAMAQNPAKTAKGGDK